MTALIAILIGCGGGGGGGGVTSTTGTTSTTATTGSVPPAPTGLTAKGGDTTVSLKWTASPGATSYTVERSTTSGGPYATIVNFLSTTSFTDGGLTNGTTYFYVVVAVNAVGPSGASNQASATPVHVGTSWLPANTIFYFAADTSDPTATDLRTVNPNGSGDSLFETEATQFTSVAANPNNQNQLLFAFTTSPNPGSDPNATYSIYRNTTVSLFGATQLTDPSTLALSSVGTILFTPDGQHILFTGAVGSDHALYMMDVNGTNLTRLVSADDAALSPDGTKIIFSQSQGAEDDLLWMGINETAGHAFLTTADTDEIMPQWSKDGTKIVYAGKPAASLSAPYDIFVVTFGGGTAGTPQKVTANGDFNLSPSFGPDGSQVAYDRISTVDVSQSGVYKVGSAGGSESIVTLNPGIEIGLYWTSNSGRALGGTPISSNRTLKKLYLPHRGR